MTDRVADILVAGAGPAGATIARLLARRGRRVVLVDPGARRTERLEIVAPPACRVVEAVGLAHLLHDPALARPCSGIRRRWGTADIEVDDFLRRPGGMGYVVDRAPFDDALRAMAMQAGVESLTGRVVAVRRDDDVIVNIQSGARRVTIAAELVVDATGRPSAVARRMGARRLVSEHLIAERQPSAVLSPPSHRDTPWLDVVGARDAWSYEVAGPNGRREIWSITRSGQRANRARMCADASSALLSRAAGPGWIAIGDAAASFDPVTSQGLANALSTALVATGAIISPEGLESACDVYSDAVAATFHHSEVGRTRVYAALTADAAR